MYTVSFCDTRGKIPVHTLLAGPPLLVGASAYTAAVDVDASWDWTGFPNLSHTRLWSLSPPHILTKVPNAVLFRRISENRFQLLKDDSPRICFVGVTVDFGATTGRYGRT
jgi:hypothetical protein